ncbi:unnamed protein product [Porites lobata]|uniref:Uncharacterized protein n=1 Tax=Porites lobata TaxID=104759 RepID=A0ABN8P777_9CNID|nr:unnamed protein product [Porites lobata]
MRSICGFLFLQAVFIGFARHTKVTATRHCPKFTSCIDSYADIYKSLASEENSFNIESALYPATMPSSLVVKVEFITHNETSVANYTWSLNCLYVAIPPQVLQLLSLGSVLVEPRTQELKICIPYFCRNFSSTKEQNDLMKGVLSALQDLAVSPGIRDPRLNTVECVIEGHETDIMATGPRRSSYITAILWCAFLFSFWAGPFIAEVIIGVLKGENNESLYCWGKCVRVQRSQASTAETALPLNSPSEPPQSGASPDSGENGIIRSHIYITLGPLILEGIVLTCVEKCPCCEYNSCNACIKAVIRFSVTLTVYHFCWLVIGIMINPVWGLAVCLMACIFVLALTFILYQIFKLEDWQCGGPCIKHIFICFGTFCGGCSFVVLAVLAGQSFYGRETADELVKTVLLYVISGFISWLSWKGNS